MLFFSWGNNLYGQLGDGTAISRSEAGKVNQEGVLKNKLLTEIEAGSFYSLVLDSDGQVYSWGFNNGLLGIGDINPRRTPVQVSSLNGTRIISIAGSSSHVLAVSTDGEVFRYFFLFFKIFNEKEWKKNAWKYSTLMSVGEAMFSVCE